MKIWLTHKGWFMFCPVLMGDIHTECPLVVPRWRILWPVFYLARVTQATVITLCSLCSAEYEPQWYMLVTGQLRERRLP